MDLLLSTSALALTTIAYGTATGMTLFDSQYKIEDPKKIFFNSSDREDRYQDYNASNFTLAVTLLVATIILFFLIKFRVKLNLVFFYIFTLFILVSAIIYYSLIGVLTFRLVRLNDNKVSTQAIINWVYAFVLLFFTIFIIVRSKIYVKTLNQKSSSSGSTRSLLSSASS